MSFATAQNLKLLKIQGMDNLNIEPRKKAGSIARAALKASVINQIKELSQTYRNFTKVYRKC
jgi:hypothetical protein